jgi:hypothetical protein
LAIDRRQVNGHSTGSNNKRPLTRPLGLIKNVECNN